MFHWICPECGREIAPAVKECPGCDPASVSAEAQISAPEIIPAALRTPLPQQPAVAQILDTVSIPAADPEILTPEILVPGFASAPIAEDPPEPAADPIPGPTPAAAPAPEPDTFADRLAALAEQLRAGHIPYKRPEGTAPKVAEPPAPRPPVMAPAERPQAASSIALLAAPAAVALLAEPGPPSVAARIPMPEVLTPRAVNSPSAAHGLADHESWTPNKLDLGTRPTPLPTPALAGLLSYAAAAAKAIRPAAPPKTVAGADAEHRITLPGPSLPRELTSLQAAGLVPVPSGRGKSSGSSGLPGWIVSFLVMAVLLIVALGAILYTQQGTQASPKVAATPDVVPVVEAEPVHPIATYVEVTGFRLVADPDKKPEIHYLVVNHSKGSLNGITVYVTLRQATAKPGQSPVSRFSFRPPKLAPNESREMISPFEATVHTASLPDWQDLRADVEISQ